MLESLLKAICLLLIIEGFIPFLYPSKWRRLVARLAKINDRQLRMVGLVSMLIGVGLLYLVG
ncbi:hypothetical protein AB835_12025 [Candidatus Endobugula sertula]|uniref:DUF2065 domain-containing protein n=1 Tax=Candidatus Endobugula sertula TaxID=62101 RepID=A0A1D2QMQ3_9GAMM|nr:hypothetical protein AB835_12025 [Candidatus Endobugula sertula]